MLANPPPEMLQRRHRKCWRSASCCAGIEPVGNDTNGWAVSSPKRNELMMMLKKVEGLRHEQFGRAPTAEVLRAPLIRSSSRWPLMDAGHVRDEAAAIFTTGPRTAALARLSQTGNQFGTQRAARHGVERGVDRLVTDLKRRVVRVHAVQYASDLFRRMVAPQQAPHVAPQAAIRRQACGDIASS